jgi:hypothetical protein
MWLGTASRGWVDTSVVGGFIAGMTVALPCGSVYSFTGLSLGVALPGCLNTCSFLLIYYIHLLDIFGCVIDCKIPYLLKCRSFRLTGIERGNAACIFPSLLVWFK